MGDRQPIAKRSRLKRVLDDVYVVPLVDRWLLHSPLRSTTAIVNTAAVRELKKADPDLVRLGALSSLIESPPSDPPRPMRGPLKPDFLGIVPTRRCNLNCLYCGFGAANASSSDLDPQLAVSAVDWMIEQARKNNAEGVDIHFFGGEPFVAPEVVDVVVHRARARSAERGLNCRFEADTNGIFDETRCRFIGDYFDSVVLSFDGPEDVHNRQRPAKGGDGSFETVSRNAVYLSRSPAELCLRVCVTSLNVKRLGSIAHWFCDQFHPAVINFEPLKPTTMSDRAGLQVPDPWEFAVRYIEAYRVASRFGVRVVYAAAAIERIQYTFCPVGRDTLIVSPDGTLSACYSLPEEWKAAGLDLTMGHLSAAGKMVLDQSAIEKMRNIPAQRNRCRRCFAQWHCAGGCHLMNHRTNRGEDYDDFCTQTRLIAAYLLLDRLGDEESLQKMVRSRRAAEVLALVASDRLSDWEE